MSGDSPTRSDLIDVTYTQLHSILSGQQDSIRPGQIEKYLEPRKKQLASIAEPFGKPSAESKKLVESGSVTLADQVVIRVDEGNKNFALAISQRYQIDEIQALILLRSFLYDQGMPPHSDPSSTDQLVEAIGPFYHSERLAALRVLIPLLRANANEDEALSNLSSTFIPKVIPDGHKFAQSVVSLYLDKTEEKLPRQFSTDPRNATIWAKQNLKEQLVLLEVLFWSMWGYVSCSAPLVVLIYEAAYSTALGSIQVNTTLLLDDDSRQLIQDCAAIWILITIEVLELETLAQPTSIQFTDPPTGTDVYYTSPNTLKRLHDLVISHTDDRFACTYLAWTFVVSRLIEAASKTPDVPDSFLGLLDHISPPGERSYTKDQPVYLVMVMTCLKLEVGLMTLIENLLTKSPLFVTAIAWKTGSSITDPNAVAYRSVIKGLICALLELRPVEMIPDFEGFIEVWIALFGRSESASVSGICIQFWRTDWHHGIARRAIIDVARSRFPIQVKPLVRLLRSMTGAGFLDTDPLYTADYKSEVVLSEERELCDKFVYHYLLQLSTYSQVIPLNLCTGAHALYERQTERYSRTLSNAANPGLTYHNLRPIKFPGGSTLPQKSTGRILSADGATDYLIVCWQHKHSGWKVLLEVLTDYVNRRRLDYGAVGRFPDVSPTNKSGSQVKILKIEDVGMELDPEGDESIVTDILDLVRSLIQDNPEQAEVLMRALEQGDSVVSHTKTETQPPDLVQLTTMILEEALSRCSGKVATNSPAKLITSAMSVLSALLAIPNYANRVWLYIRSATSLFGSDRSPGFASVALAAERATGCYTMTLSLLHLIGQLFREALLSILPDNAKLQQLKEEVLLRAARFVHTEIWVEHMSWKYAQLGDRFDISSRISSMYAQVLEYSPPAVVDRPFSVLSQSIVDVLLFKATTSTINPLVSSISSSKQVIGMLSASRRHSDVRRLIFLLQSNLHLCRLILTHKVNFNVPGKPCLLEQALCARATGGPSYDSTHTKSDPIDILANYIKSREVGNVVPVEAGKLLCSLINSLSISQSSPPTIFGHLSNPDTTVASLVRIIQHPYEDLSLRKTVWDFISLAVDKEPALAMLFVSGRARSPGEFKEIEVKEDEKKKEGEKKKEDEKKKKEDEKKKGDEPGRSTIRSALDVAREIIVTWSELWDVNPLLLSCVLRFLETVWRHFLEHKSVVGPLREDKNFWDIIVSIACRELTPLDSGPNEIMTVEKIRHASQNDATQQHAYRVLVKSYATRIIACDIGLHLQFTPKDTSKPMSYRCLQPMLEENVASILEENDDFLSDALSDALHEAASSSYAPEKHDQLTALLEANFVGLTLQQLELQAPVWERDYGDNFAFSVPLLRSRLQAYPLKQDSMGDPAEEAELQLMVINLNLSIVHAESAFVEAWTNLINQAKPYMEIPARKKVFAIVPSISSGIAGEKRQGEMMASIYSARLSLVLAMVEVMLSFSCSKDDPLVKLFMFLTENVRNMILNEYQSPSRSFLSNLPNPFHRTLLQLVFYCCKEGRSMANRNVFNAEQRNTFSQTVETVLSFVIDSLRVVFVSARSRTDLDLDRDMELLVAIFEQCSKPDTHVSSVYWLARCQENDIIRASLELFVHIDLVGVSDLPLLLTRKAPLYSPHLLLFHMSLASNSAAAERLASEGVLSAYSNNYISSAISSGRIDIVLPELPGQRSPAHVAYCSMVSIVAMVISALGKQNHYFEADACGFIQFYAEQISRALSWTIGDPITRPLLEEIDQVINLFYALATSVPASARPVSVVEPILRGFTNRSLHLLQQVNYAITHPNQLATLYEPVTQYERVRFEKDESQNDPMKRNYVAHLIHRLFQISTNLVGTLVTISKADTVLSHGAEDWPVSEALIVPHSKVVLGEPASLGTLLELGNRSFLLLRRLVQRPPDQGVFDPDALFGSYQTAKEVKQGVIIIRRNLEEILLYSATQLGMWLSKPDFDIAPMDAEADDAQGMDVTRQDGGKARQAARPSMTMAERLRRGMTGEMASDLQSLITKSKPILVASDTIIGKPSVDLTQVLLNFLHERIGGS